MRLLFLLIFIGLNSYSQKVIIEDVGDLKKVGIDSIHNKLFLFYDGYYDKLDLKTLEKSKHKIFTDTLFDIGGYTYIAVDASQFFLSSGGGMVYQFKNDTIKRIDNSFDHRMQTGTSIFHYNSKIYKYGGYGFWSARNFFIYFDENTREWEVNEWVSSKQIPDGTYGNQFILYEDDIYLFDGVKIDPNKRLERIKNNEVWNYNFKDHRWKYLGIYSLLDDGEFIKYKSKILNIGISYITEIDIINNHFTTYQHNLLSPKLTSTFPSFYLDQNFYCFISKRGVTSLKQMSEEVFLKTKLSSGIFYKNYPYWVWLFVKYFVFPVLGILLIWLGFLFYRKNKKIILLNNGIRIKNSYVEFDNESMEIIKLLLLENEVTSNQILSIVEKDQYSPAHNERVKVQKLNDINLKIKALLGVTENIIDSRKSEKDRRIKIYTLNKVYFNRKM